MSIEQDLVKILDEVLNLGGRGATMDRGTRLFGAMPELDSMSVMGVIAALEGQYGFTVTAHELESSTFDTVGSLADFIQAKLDEASDSAPQVLARPERLLTLAFYTVSSIAPGLCVGD